MRKITFATLLLPMLLQASSYYCQTNNGTYSDSTLCASACGGTACQTLDPLSSGNSGACDTTKYSYFVSDGKKTYGISKVSGFWTDFSSLAIPTDSNTNTLIASLSKYAGKTAWIGVYDPLKSSGYNTVTPSRFTDSNGLSLSYLNWASGQPDNKLDNADIGTTPINGEQWAYIQNDGTWADDGYHVSYGGSYKPSRPAIVEWNGPLDCVNGTPPATTSSSTGYWCSDGSTQAQCTSQSSPACTSPAVWDASTGECKSSGSSTYAATRICTASFDSGGSDCSNGNGYCYAQAGGECGTYRTDSWADSHCSDRTLSIMDANGNTTSQVVHSEVSFYVTFDSSCAVTNPIHKFFSLYSRSDKNGLLAELVSSSIAGYGCPSGGTISGTTCTVNTTTYAAPTCPAGTVLNTTTGNCDSQVCPLGNYTCNDITGSVQNTDTPQGANDKTDNGTKDSSGNCLGQIYIFNGNDDRCRPGGIQTGYSDCCKKGDTWFGIGKCSSTEKTLGTLRKFGDLDGNCHYIGSYCAEKWPLVGCVQDKKTYCCYSSPLARIIQEGGHTQLGISWGTPTAPQCRGFTPTEFQKIDFSKIDFSDWVNNQVKTQIQNNAAPTLTNTANNIKNSF